MKSACLDLNPASDIYYLCFCSHLTQCLSLTAAAKSLQSCPSLCNPIDGSPPGSPVPGILQARVLEWGASAFSTLTSNTL